MINEEKLLEKQRREESKKYHCPHCNCKFFTDQHLKTIQERFNVVEENPDFAKFFNDINMLIFYENEYSSSEIAESKMFTDLFKVYYFVMDLSPLLPVHYTSWAITAKIPSYRWTTDSTFKTFVKMFNNRMSIYDAYNHSIANMQFYANQYGFDWKEYFKVVPVSKLFFDLQNGRISPWLLIASSWGKKKYASMTDEQIDTVFDKTVWFDVKFKEEDSLNYIRRKVILEGIR